MRIVYWLKKLWNFLSYRLSRPRIVVTKALLSGEGTYIDIRFWLTRPDKANGKFPIFLIEEGSGKRLELLRFTKYGCVKTDSKSYQSGGVVVFRNKESSVKAGSLVSLVFGSLISKHIKVM